MILLAGFSARHLVVGAGNDGYAQVLAAEGLRSGQGYGFEINGRFVAMGAMSFRTSARWPPGLTFVAWLLVQLGLNPVIVLVWFQPLLLSLTLLVITLALRRSLGDVMALGVALVAVTPMGLMRWYLWLGTEPLCFFLLACLFYVVATRENLASRRVLLLLFALITCITMLRTAAAFFTAPFLVAASLVRWPRALTRAALVAFGSGFLFHLPLVAFQLSSFGVDKTAAPARLIPNADFAAFALRELRGHLGDLPEAFLPRAYSIFQWDGLMEGTGWLLAIALSASLVATFASIRRQSSADVRTERSIGFVSGLSALGYVGLLSVAGAISDVELARSYRYTAFALPFITVSISALLCSLSWARTRSVLMIGALLLVGGVRYGLEFRTEARLASARPSAVDYRETVADVRRALTELGADPQTVVWVFTGGSWHGRHLFRRLEFARRFGSSLWLASEAPLLAELDLRATSTSIHEQTPEPWKESLREEQTGSRLPAILLVDKRDMQRVASELGGGSAKDPGPSWKLRESSEYVFLHRR